MKNEVKGRFLVSMLIFVKRNGEHKVVGYGNSIKFEDLFNKLFADLECIFGW